MVVEIISVSVSQNSIGILVIFNVETSLKCQFSHTFLKLEEKTTAPFTYYFCYRPAVQKSTVSFYPKEIVKTLLIYRSLSKKDLKFTLSLITLTFIELLLSHDIGFTVGGKMLG